MNIRNIIKESLLLEVGRLGDSYSYQGPSEYGYNQIIYKFNDKNNAHYIVKFTSYPDEVWDREYTADGKYEETGSKDVFKVLSTVTKITLDFIKEFNPDVLKIHHVDSKKEVDKRFQMLKKMSADEVIQSIRNSSNKRALLNKTYLENNLPKRYTYTLKGSQSIIKRNG